jgi:FkbM family methyltransferase
MRQRVRRFLAKTPDARAVALRFAARKWLAGLAWVPTPLYVRLPAGERQWFWWSRVPPWFEPEMGALEQPGPDLAELRFLCRVVRPGMCFFDVGAYHGLYAVVAGRRMQGRGRLVLFEPSARARRRIGVHLALNRLRASVETRAVASTHGPRSFYLVVSGTETMSALVPPPTPSPVRRVTVESVSLDEYCAEQQVARVDLLKIDVEGGELEAFDGAGRLLEVMRPLIIAEVLDWVTRPRGYAARDIVRRLAALDYTWFDFTPGGGIAPHVPAAEYPDVRNYLAVPREKLAAVSHLVDTPRAVALGA